MCRKFLKKAGMLIAIAFASILNSNASDEAGGLRASDAERRVVAYVTSYSDVRPSAFDITNINYAFGSVNETFDGVDISNPERLKDIVTLKRENPNLEVQLSIGGWRSGRFSEMAANQELRKSFAEDCRRIVEEYGLDGVDIDWEYPTSSAAGISSSPDDTENFTLLMKDLRSALPEGALLTLASIYNAKFIDFPAIMPYVDFVNIMSYDMATPPLHHGPLHASVACGSKSAEYAVKAHLAAGIPAKKLTMGIPFYGRGKAPYTDFVDYKDIIVKDGCSERWDDEAKAPYIVDGSGTLVLGYDNPQSIALKCDYIKDAGLLGAMYWDYACDGPEHPLSKTVAENLLFITHSDE